MERLLLYLAVAAAVLAVLLAARLKPQPDHCIEARRLAAAVLAVNQSQGWIVDMFYLDRELEISERRLRHAGCGVELRIGIKRTPPESEGRWVRLIIRYDHGATNNRTIVIEPAGG